MAKYEKKSKKNDPSFQVASRNLPAKKYQHSSPTSLRLSFEFTGNATKYIDIAKALSAINRQFVSQQAYYYVNSVELYNNEDAFVDLHTLQDTWVTKNAYVRARHLFNQMNQSVEGSLTSGIQSKYADFKVFMSTLHRTTGSADPSTYDINSAPTTVTSDDWDYTRLVTADDDGDASQNADKFFLHMVGGHVGSAADWTSVGLIKSYAESRVTVNASSPDQSQIDLADPLMNLFDYSSEETVNEILTLQMSENDQPPYNYDLYVGEANGSLCQQARLATTALVGRKTVAPGFCAPFGLICVDPQDTATAFRVVLNLAPGPYHGTYAERV